MYSDRGVVGQLDTSQFAERPQYNTGGFECIRRSGTRAAAESLQCESETYKYIKIYKLNKRM